MSRAKKNNVKLSPRERFELFTEKVDQLRNLRLVQSGELRKLNGGIPFDKTGPLPIFEPDEDDLRSFLLLFRQFVVSNDEPIFVPTVLNDCLRFSTSNCLTKQITEVKSFWKENIKGPKFTEGGIYGEIRIPKYSYLDLWINGYYFHSDNPEKAAELKTSLQHRLPIARVSFLILLLPLTDAIFYLDFLISSGLDQALFDFSRR